MAMNPKLIKKAYRERKIANKNNTLQVILDEFVKEYKEEYGEGPQDVDLTKCGYVKIGKLPDGENLECKFYTYKGEVPKNKKAEVNDVKNNKK